MNTTTIPGFSELFNSALTTFQLNWMKFLKSRILYFGSIFIYLILISIISLFLSPSSDMLKSDPNLYYQKTFLIQIVILISAIILYFFTIRLAINLFQFDLAIVRGENPKSVDVLKKPTNSASEIMIFLASLAQGFVIVVGFLFFIIPGVYFRVKYTFVTYLMMTKDISISEAFAQSAILTKGIKLNLIIYVILLGFVTNIIVFVGLLMLCVGVIPAIFIASMIEQLFLIKLFDSLLLRLNNQ